MSIEHFRELAGIYRSDGLVAALKHDLETTLERHPRIDRIAEPYKEDGIHAVVPAVFATYPFVFTALAGYCVAAGDYGRAIISGCVAASVTTMLYFGHQKVKKMDEQHSRGL